MSKNYKKHKILRRKGEIDDQLFLLQSQSPSQDSYIPSALDDEGSSMYSYEEEEEQFDSSTKKAAQVEKISGRKELEIGNMISARILEKISNFQNKLLYPPYLGPHPIYTKDSVENGKCEISVVELRSKLFEWIKFFYSNQFSQIEEKHILKSINQSGNVKLNSQIFPKKQKTYKKSKISGVKYNKYSLEFKMNVVNKIEAKLMEKQGKSLRKYICQQAKFLGIHPKNITRWFDTKDLDRTEGGRKAQFPILEYRLAKLIQENPKIKRREVINEGKEILREIGQGQKFSFSKGWYERFRIRMRDHKVERCMQRIINEDKYKDEAISYLKLEEKVPKTYASKQKENRTVKFQQNYEDYSKVKFQQGVVRRNERRNCREAKLSD